MPAWFTLLTRLPEAEISALLAGHPREAKARLAIEIVTFFHSRDEAEAALEGFNRQFRDRELPEDIPSASWPSEDESLPLAILLKELELAKSSSEARRLVQQGGVRLDGEVRNDPMESVARPQEPLLIQVGKRRFVTLTA
jgi:tyrosyl-tRNA synthetase